MLSTLELLTHQGVGFTCPHGHILWLNQTAQNLMGVVLDDVRIKGVLDQLDTEYTKDDIAEGIVWELTAIHSQTPLKISFKPVDDAMNEALDLEATLSVPVPATWMIELSEQKTDVSVATEDEALTQAQSDFISTISHEFRTPLTSIKGFSDTILSYGSNLPVDQQRRFVTIIRDQADRLIRLTENLLSVSREGNSHSGNGNGNGKGKGQHQKSFRPLNLSKVIQSVITSLDGRYAGVEHQPSKRIQLTIHDSVPEVWADRDTLEQVLINLLDNALKYSKDDAPVLLNARVCPNNEKYIRLDVQDKGIGISEANLKNLFTRFYRVESPLTQNVEGSGLGLYITRSLVTALGGTIDVTSVEGEGSTFTITLKSATPEVQADYRRRQAMSDEDVLDV